MKIIYLHQYFNTPEMSGGTRSYEMARRMVAAGHDVHIVTSFREENANQSGWFKTEEVGINVHWYPVPYYNHMSFWQRIKAFLKFALAARKKTVELDGDIIFATSTPLTIAFPAVLASRKKNIPMVFEVRDLWPEVPIAVGALNNPLLRFAAHKLEHWAYHNAEAVVALSPGMKDGVVRTGYPSRKIAVIPNSSDNAEFQYNAKAANRFREKYQFLDNKPLLVYTGTFGLINGVKYLVDLAKELLKVNSDVKILLVGDGAEREKIIQEAKQAGVLDRNLFMIKRLPKKEMPALLSAATMASSLFVDLPEMRSNSANKFFDAMASGTPILLNYGGWMHELVLNHSVGLPMWGRSVSEVALELDKKMHDTEWLEESGRKARFIAENYFARDLLADQLMKVFQLVNVGAASDVSKVAVGKYS